MDTLLIITTFIPLASAGLIALCAGAGREAVRAIALVSTLLTLGCAAWLAASAPSSEELAKQAEAVEKTAAESKRAIAEDVAAELRRTFGVKGVSETPAAEEFEGLYHDPLGLGFFHDPGPLELPVYKADPIELDVFPRPPDWLNYQQRVVPISEDFTLDHIGAIKEELGEQQPEIPSGEFAVSDYAWMPLGSPVDIRFSLGLDGLSVWLYALSALLLVTSVLVSWNAISQRPALFYGMLLLLQTGCLGVFAARDILLFYVFFEFTLIPLFFLIGIWGSDQRRYAAIKFFLFTLAGSVLTLLGLLAIVIWNYFYSGTSLISFSIPEITQNLGATPIPISIQIWIFFALFAGFAVKVPLFPLHTWLPLAHTEAPTAGSVILAGVLLKIGTYGFLRFNMPMLPAATAELSPLLLWLSVAGIIYGALVALAQKDIKRLIAYSSVSHMGFCMLGLFALNRLGNQGAVLQMINHGISTGALFAIVGMLYERYHTRKIADYSGIARKLPLLTLMMFFFTFSSIGLPGLNGFAGEFLLLAGMFQRGFGDTGFAGDIEHATQLKAIAVIAVLGVVLGAWYMLWLVERVFLGPLREPAHEPVQKYKPANDKNTQTEDVASHQPIRDLSFREIVALAPLVVLAFWIGLYPKYFLDRMEPAVFPITDRVAAAAAAEQPSAQNVAGTGKAPGRGATVPEQRMNTAVISAGPSAPLAEITAHLEHPPVP